MKNLDSNDIQQLILKGRNDYIENKGKEPNECYLRPEHYYELEFVKGNPEKVVFANMNLFSSTYVPENSMILYFNDYLSNTIYDYTRNVITLEVG